MISTTTEFRRQTKYRRNFSYIAEIAFSDGRTSTLTADDLLADGSSIVSSAESQAFPLGNAVAKRAALQFTNYWDQYADYDFYDAKIHLYLYYLLDSGLEEKLDLGIYTVREPETYGSTITVSASDGLYKADREYKSMLSYPAPMHQVLSEACTNSGLVLLNQSSIPNRDYLVYAAPESVTCRQVIGMCAMLAGGNAFCRGENGVFIREYDFSLFDTLGDLDGGRFDADLPYSSGDTADGGSFRPWNTGDQIDCGNFDRMALYHILSDGANLTVSTDDVVITGVKISAGEEEFSCGVPGYVLTLENQLFAGNEQDAAERIGALLIGSRFRPFTMDHISYPAAEVGDLCYVADRKGRYFRSVITDIDYQLKGYTTFKCSADSPIRNSSKYVSQSEVKATVTAKKDTEKKISEYDAAVKVMSSILTNSLGMFQTVEKTPNGGEIVYQHNKPNLSDSNVIWKKTETAFMVSTDGGTTWNAGIDAEGNAVVNVLSAAGIRFDWAKGGSLTLGGENDVNGVLYVLDANGNVREILDKSGLSSTNGSVSTDVTAGKIRFFNGSELLGQIYPGVWAGTDSMGLSWKTAGTHVAFTVPSNTEGLNYAGLVINNSLNPSGYTEKNIFFGASRIVGNMDVSGYLGITGDVVSKGYLIAKEMRFSKDSGEIAGSFIFEEDGGFRISNNRNPGFVFKFDNTEKILKATLRNEKRSLVYSTASKERRVETINFNYYSGASVVFFGINDDGEWAEISLHANSSDVRLKENIFDTDEDAISAIEKMKVRKFDWKSSGIHQKVGVIADELEKIDENLSSGGGSTEDGAMIIKSVNTLTLDAYLIKGMQEMYEMIQSLQKEVKELRKEVNRLKEG